MSNKAKLEWDNKDIKRWIRNDCDANLIANVTESVREACGLGWESQITVGNRVRGYVRIADGPDKRQTWVTEARDHTLEQAIGQANIGGDAE